MTYASQTQVLSPSLALEMSAVLHHMVQAVSDYLLYRATLRALRAASDTALVDLGLHRSSLRAEARKAVYGV